MSRQSMSDKTEPRGTPAATTTVEPPKPEVPPVPTSPAQPSALPKDFQVLQRPGGGELLFNPKTLRSARVADDKIGVTCFYGNTTGEDANCRGKLPTAEAALAWLADEKGAAVPA